MQGSSPFIIAFITLAVAWALDLYVFQGVKTAISGWEKGWARTLVYWSFWVVSIWLAFVNRGGIYDYAITA